MVTDHMEADGLVEQEDKDEEEEDIEDEIERILGSAQYFQRASPRFRKRCP